MRLIDDEIKGFRFLPLCMACKGEEQRGDKNGK